MASKTPSAVRSATGLTTSARLQRWMTPPSGLPMLLASQYAATSTTVIANVPRNPARMPARSQSSRGASVDNGWARERSLLMVSSPVIRVVMSGAKGRRSLGKGLTKIYERHAVMDVIEGLLVSSPSPSQNAPLERDSVARCALYQNPGFFL